MKVRIQTTEQTKNKKIYSRYLVVTDLHLSDKNFIYNERNYSSPIMHGLICDLRNKRDLNKLTTKIKETSEIKMVFFQSKQVP